MYEIQSVSFKRIILHIEGRSDEPLSGTAFYLENTSSSQRIPIEECRIEGNKFHLRINVLERCEEYPIPSGDWLLCAQSSGKEKSCPVLSPEICQKITDNKALSQSLYPGMPSYWDEDADDDDNDYEDDSRATIERESDTDLMIYKKSNNRY